MSSSYPSTRGATSGDPVPKMTTTAFRSAQQKKQQNYGDATLVGKHCEADYCNQLDFLPFLCQSCNKTFCLDHRTEAAHKCAQAGAWAERKRLAHQAHASVGGDRILRGHISEKDCAVVKCSTRIGTSLVPGVHCSRCNRDYCLKHRFEEDHACSTLTPIGARPSATVGDIAVRARGKFNAWIAKKKEAAGRALPKPKPTSASQRTRAVVELKKDAKGDEKTPPEKRVYLFVEAEAATTSAKISEGRFFYSRDWVVGRALDAAARSLQIENVNNQTCKEEDKLRVFHVEGGRVLEFNEKVGAALDSGNTIVLLRGIGPTTPDLIEA